VASHQKEDPRRRGTADLLEEVAREPAAGVPGAGDRRVELQEVREVALPLRRRDREPAAIGATRLPPPLRLEAPRADLLRPACEVQHQTGRGFQAERRSRLRRKRAQPAVLQVDHLRPARVPGGGFPEEGAAEGAGHLRGIVHRLRIVTGGTPGSSRLEPSGAGNQRAPRGSEGHGERGLDAEVPHDDERQDAESPSPRVLRDEHAAPPIGERPAEDAHPLRGLEPARVGARVEDRLPATPVDGVPGEAPHAEILRRRGEGREHGHGVRLAAARRPGRRIPSTSGTGQQRHAAKSSATGRAGAASPAALAARADVLPGPSLPPWSARRRAR